METKYVDALFCPKKEERVYFENCKAICPKQYLENLIVTVSGRVRCIFCPTMGKTLFKC